MTDVLDASAIIAYLQGEPGADLVKQSLVDGAACCAANWSEVAQKVRAAGRDWTSASALLHAHDLAVEPLKRVPASVSPTAAALLSPNDSARSL
jgi:ribonuclease VapC